MDATAAPTPCRKIRGSERDLEGFGTAAIGELAVVMDTFRPLRLTAAARAFEDERYPFSWLEQPGGFKGSDSMG